MYNIRPVTIKDTSKILDLYQKVAQQPGGIIRNYPEVTQGYIEDFVEKSLNRGLILTIPNPNNEGLIAEIHAHQLPLAAFRHILTDLTIVVDPEFQGQGIGKLLFQYFLNTIEEDHQDILRLELFVRENNTKSIRFYTNLGFKNEGKHTYKIKNPDNSLETPIHMAWFNPKYNTAL